MPYAAATRAPTSPSTADDRRLARPPASKTVLPHRRSAGSVRVHAPARAPASDRDAERLPFLLRYLLIADSVAQWTVVAWFLAVGLRCAVAWPLHLGAIAGIYAVNRRLTAGRSLIRAAGVFHTYAATAFVSLFRAIFLGLAWVGFAAIDEVLHLVSARAFGAAGQLAVQAGVGDAFRWTGSLGIGAIAVLMGYGYVAGQRALRLTRLSVPMRGLGHPLRVTQISDLHIGPNLSRAQLDQFVDEVNATDADLICITGDIADSPQADLDACFPVLGRLWARQGVCAILGNHDHGAGADRVVAALRRWTDFRVLRDAAITIDCRGGRLHVIGLDDRGRDWARGMACDPQLADLLSAAPAGIPVLLSPTAQTSSRRRPRPVSR